MKFIYKPEKGDGYAIDRDEKGYLHKATAGDKLQLALIDRVTRLLKLWLPVKDLRGFKPVDIAEFDEAIGLDKELAFEWWNMMIDPSLLGCWSRFTNKANAWIIEHSKRDL